MTSANQKPKLKWHRFLQIIGLPVTILAACYRLISLFTDLAGLDLAWTDHSLREWLSVAGTDVFHLGPYFWPVVAVLAGELLLFVLALLAWTGSLRWRSYSWKCWIALLFIQMGMVFAGIFYMWEYGLNRGGLINLVQYYFMRTGKEIQVTSAMITAIRVFLVLTGILALLYFILNVIYYMKRRSLYSAGDDIQLPYEESEDTDIHQADIQTEPVYKTPEQTSAEPAAIAADEPEPSNDELDQMLKDTEDSIASLKPAAETEAAAPASDETEEIRLSLDPVEEPLPAFTRTAVPFAEEEETDPVSESAEESLAVEEPAEEEAETAEKPAAEPVQSTEEEPAAEEITEPETPEIPFVTPAEEVSAPDQPEIRFCPDCGTKIPDPEMRFCIHCGRRIR